MWQKPVGKGEGDGGHRLRDKRGVRTALGLEASTLLATKSHWRLSESQCLSLEWHHLTSIWAGSFWLLCQECTEYQSEATAIIQGKGLTSFGPEGA